PRRLTQGGGSFAGVAWSPDGVRLAAIRYPAVFDDPKHNQVGVIDSSTGDVTLLTGALDRNCGPYPAIRGPIWDGEDIVFAVEDRGNTHVYRVPSDGNGKPELVVGGERMVTGYDVVGSQVVFTATDPAQLSEVHSADDRALSNVGHDFVTGREIV